MNNMVLEFDENYPPLSLLITIVCDNVCHVYDSVNQKCCWDVPPLNKDKTSNFFDSEFLQSPGGHSCTCPSPSRG